MKAIMLPLAVLASGLVLHASDIEITSFSSNGRLSWTNSFTNGVYSIQWASALTTNTEWQDTWDILKYLNSASNATKVNVPMFYRVKCMTNVFMPLPLGQEARFSISNRFGTNIGTLQMRALGVLTIPSSGIDYILSERVSPSGTNRSFESSTDRAVYSLDTCGPEYLEWTNGPVGTTWMREGGCYPNDIMTIVSTSAAVTNPVRIFSGCLVFSNTSTHGVFRVKPGFGIVRVFDAFNGDPNVPYYYELQSVTNY